MYIYIDPSTSDRGMMARANPPFFSNKGRSIPFSTISLINIYPLSSLLPLFIAVQFKQVQVEDENVVELH